MPASPGTRRWPAGVLLVLLLSGCSSGTPATDPGPAWLEDATGAAGLAFTHDAGDLSSYYMPASMGSGCAFLDADADGLLDVYLTHLAGPKGPRNRLFRQVSPGRFVDASAGSGLDIADFCQGVAVGDVDNDGPPDIVVACHGGVRLFRNKGGCRFEEVKDAGLDNPLWAASAAFLDFDRDGWLDLVVVNYLDYPASPGRSCPDPRGKPEFCGPDNAAPLPSRLFRNLGGQGKPGRFEDVSANSGLASKVAPGLGVVCADFTGDGWLDIFISNDGRPNHLWVNQRNGTFKDEAESREVAKSEGGKAMAGMGIAAGDVSGSGRLDLLVTHLGTQTHTLWKQDAPGLFSDATTRSRVAETEWRGTGFGTQFADLDNSGRLHLALVNGRIIRGGKAEGTGLGFWEPYAEKNQLLANDGKGRFRDVSAANPAFCGYWNVGRALAVGDYDNDGGLDLLVLPTGGPARLLRNVAPDRGEWLKVKATAWGRDAEGAEIRVRAGGQAQLRLLTTAGGYMTANPAIAHFGLGAAKEYEGVEVSWPDGTREKFGGGKAGRTVTLAKGGGTKP